MILNERLEFLGKKSFIIVKLRKQKEQRIRPRTHPRRQILGRKKETMSQTCRNPLSKMVSGSI